MPYQMLTGSQLSVASICMLGDILKCVPPVALCG